jgi:kumamolisin
MAHIPLEGSERAAMAGATALSPISPDERFEVTVLVRRRAGAQFSARVAALSSGQKFDAHLTREEFAQRHGADAGDVGLVRAFAASYGLQVVEEHAARRSVVLSGTARQFCAAFQVQLHHCQHAGGTYRGRTGPIQIPEELKGIVVAVLGLDNRPQAKAHFRLRPARPAAPAAARPAAAAATSFTPPQVASLYQFPAGTGAGECVALIELGGGFRPADLQSYFAGLSLSAPTVVAVSVDHATNAPSGNANGPDGEVMLDIEVAGSIASQAKIAVYFAPNTDAGFLDAITTAVHDTTNKPSVISISWGGPESSWTAQAMTAMDDAFQAAATLGVTVCVASGDNGSSDGVADGADHVDFPASSPFALACGGTRLAAAANRISAETVWNDGASGGATGGGISTQFAAASWQAELSAISTAGQKTLLTKRGVPDVAGNADPESGYNVRVDGTDTVIGGTSAVAPLWAALIACINQGAGKSAGYLNPQLYKKPAALRDITQGNNGDFSAASGWDACTGLGSPDGSALPGALAT